MFCRIPLFATMCLWAVLYGCDQAPAGSAADAASDAGPFLDDGVWTNAELNQAQIPCENAEDTNRCALLWVTSSEDRYNGCVIAVWQEQDDDQPDDLGRDGGLPLLIPRRASAGWGSVPVPPTPSRGAFVQ